MRARLALVAVCLASLFAASAAEGYSNGRLPDSALSPIATGASCNQLRSDAAAGFNSLALAYGRPLSINGCLSAYRSYAGQVQLRNYWCGLGNCGNAAVPGTSNHGWGLAIDASSSTQAVIAQTGRYFGFCKCWSDAAWEPWHILYRPGTFKRPDPGINLASPTMRRGSGGAGQQRFVKELQKKLRRHGDRTVTRDGDFGRKTASAVKRFQRSHGLKPDGVVGPNTWSKLRGPVTRDPEPPKPAPAPRGPVNGIDVSMHQGDVNWDAVRRDGVEFAIVKATEGEDYRDPRFNQQRLEAMHQNGIVAGTYHYLRPKDGRRGAVEAAWYLQNLQNAGFGVGEIRPVLDVEETALGLEATCEYVRDTDRAIRKQLGVKPMIYSFVSFIDTYLSRCGDWITRRPLWIAAPGNPDPDVRPWPGYSIRQYTFEGRVDGISGDVDQNVIPGGREVLNDLRIDEPEKRRSCERRRRGGHNPNKAGDRGRCPKAGGRKDR